MGLNSELRAPSSQLRVPNSPNSRNSLNSLHSKTIDISSCKHYVSTDKVPPLSGH